MTRQTSHLAEAAVKRMRRRKRQEALIKWAGRSAFVIALGVLAGLLFSIALIGHSAFFYKAVDLDVSFTPSALTNTSDVEGVPDYRQSDFRPLIAESFDTRLRTEGLSHDADEIIELLSVSGAPDALRKALHQSPRNFGQTVSVLVPFGAQAEQYLKGKAAPQLTADQIALLEALRASGWIRSPLNWRFLSSVDSQDAELAGVAGALIGSILTLLIAFVLCVPLGVGAAIYLEEFARTNRFTRFIEININNLAAVPALVFGLLGLAFLLNTVGLPRSIPLVAGIVFALRTFPTIIITTRSALKLVPQSIRDSALSLGATPVQAVFHHKLPVASPTIVTGIIIALAQAFGETAPLLMIGMVAFVPDIPEIATDPATTLPVQIFLWSEAGSTAWHENTAAAILVLLVVLVMLNGLAAYVRRRLEKFRN